MVVVIPRRTLLAGAPLAIAGISGARAAVLDHDNDWWAKPRVRNRAIIKLRAGLDPGYPPFIAAISPSGASVTRYFALEDAYLLVDPIDDIEPLARQLERSDWMEWVHPDSLSKGRAVPADPYYDGTTQTQPYLSAMNCPAAWDTQKLVGMSGIVPVVDMNTGIQGTHPDLTGNVLAGYNAVALSTLAANASSDTDGHGTLCGALVCATTDNGVGMASIGWGGKLIPVKVSNTLSGFSSADVLTGLQWIMANVTPPAVICMPFSGAPGYIATLAALWGAGFFITAGAGDTGSSTCDTGPCNSPFVLGTGFTTTSFARGTVSSYGPSISTGGAGCLISAVVGNSNFWTANIGSTYSAGFTGTSFSAPLIAGAVAYCWTARPALRNTDLWDIFVNAGIMQATTGFAAAPYNAPCLDLNAALKTSLSYRRVGGNGSRFLGRRR